MIRLANIFLLLVFVPNMTISLTVRGFKFGESKTPWLQDPSTGYAEVNISISSQFSFCAWIFANSFSQDPGNILQFWNTITLNNLPSLFTCPKRN